MRHEQAIVRTLGTAQVDVGAIQVRPNAVRRFAALLYLSAEPGRRVPRRCLIDLLFPGQTERNGLHSLRELVYQLRTLGVGLDADQDGIELATGSVRVDYAEMLQSERLTIEQIRAAQGGFLPGYVPHDSEAYKEWFERFRTRTVYGLSRVLLRDHDRARDVANLEMAELTARACMALSPLNERAVKALAETMFLGGAKADATQLLNQYVAEVGSRSPDLKLSAEALRRRLAERVMDPYRAPAELPFGGRDAELLTLRRLFVASRAHRTQAAVVIGEPGLGKTRLVSEFAAIASLSTTQVARVVAQPQDRTRPMGTFVDLVPTLLQLPGAIGIAPDSLDALRRLTTRTVSEPNPRPAAVDADSVSHRITHALDDLISAITLETHLTLIVDDAHWCDPVSLRGFAALATGNRPLLLLLTSRERHLPDLGERFSENAGLLVLQPLEPDVSRQLVERALRGTDGEHHVALHSWMVDVANGNPLFVSLLVAHFTASRTAFAVPPSLQELIIKRLDSLDSNATLVLQTCALLGALATLPRLVAILDLRYIDAVAAVGRLESLRLVRCVDNRLIPSHSLFVEALLNRSSPAVLRLLHLRIAAVLEADLMPGESPTVLWNCAEHWVAAGEHGAAAKFLRQCADHAAEIGHPGAAADILLRVASLHHDAQLRINVLREAIRLASQAFEHEMTLAAVGILRGLEATATHDEIELIELHVLSVTNRNSENYERRILSCLAATTLEAEHRVRAGLSGLQWADSQSNSEFAERIANRISRADLTTVDPVLSLEYQLVFQTVLGDPLEAGNIARRIRELAPTLPLGRAAGLLLNASRVLIHADATEEAIVAAEEGYQAARQCGGARLQMQASLLLCGVLLEAGRPEMAQTWRARARDARERNPHLLSEFEYRFLEIEFSLAEGHLSAAEANLASAEREGVFNSEIRLRWQRVLRARLNQLRGGTGFTHREAMEIAKNIAGSVPSTGIADLEMAAVYTALSMHRDRIGARTVLKDFLLARHRHSRAPLANQLQLAISAQTELMVDSVGQPRVEGAAVAD
jgi:DNA-binding SARP family transcriptional activator